MASQTTMQELAEAFIKLTEAKAPEKISVSDIIVAAGKNRKTFYYHFVDKNQLIIWIFRSDFAEELEKRFDGTQLVFESGNKEPYSNLPYYAFSKRGVRSLDGSLIIEALAACFESRRDYYAKILRMTEFGNLTDYLYQLFTPAMRRDVEFVLSNRQLSEASIDFLAEYYAGSFLSIMVRRACNPHVGKITEGIGPFVNIVHSSLENAIKEQQLKRML
jgi:AcrR family transcriptional regulator